MWSLMADNFKELFTAKAYEKQELAIVRLSAYLSLLVSRNISLAIFVLL